LVQVGRVGNIATTEVELLLQKLQMEKIIFLYRDIVEGIQIIQGPDGMSSEKQSFAKM
jgi:hypothetical protein